MGSLSDQHQIAAAQCSSHQLMWCVVEAARRAFQIKYKMMYEPGNVEHLALINALMLIEVHAAMFALGNVEVEINAANALIANGKAPQA